jgi:membrane protein DedA with SNARE-associated domain
MHDLLHQLGAWSLQFKDWYQHSLASGGYPLIVILMAMESSIIPIPSEVVVPPAAYLAYSQGNLTLPGVVIAATIGCWIGASVMYWAARWAGRPLILRYGRYVLIPAPKVVAAEAWATRFGRVGIFISRMIPVVRHLIGIPAGIVRMNYSVFSVYTVLGSAIWCGILAWVGIIAGTNEALMRGDVRQITLWVTGSVLILGGLYYFFVHRLVSRSTVG